MTNPEDTGWVNPHDGKTYYEGDSIPAYLFDSSGALVYGEACVRLNDPGFMGVVMVKHQGRTITKVSSQPMNHVLYQNILQSRQT